MTPQSHSWAYIRTKLYLKETRAPHVHCSTIHNSQDMETTQMSIDRGLDSEDVAYIHDGILLSHQKERHHAICSNMDETRDSHPEWNEPERQRQIPYDITYSWNLISSTNEHLLRKENHGLGEKTCGCLRGGKLVLIALGEVRSFTLEVPNLTCCKYRMWNLLWPQS